MRPKALVRQDYKGRSQYWASMYGMNYWAPSSSFPNLQMSWRTAGQGLDQGSENCPALKCVPGPLLNCRLGCTALWPHAPGGAGEWGQHGRAAEHAPGGAPGRSPGAMLSFTAQGYSLCSLSLPLDNLIIILIIILMDGSVWMARQWLPLGHVMRFMLAPPVPLAGSMQGRDYVYGRPWLVNSRHGPCGRRHVRAHHPMLSHHINSLVYALIVCRQQ